MSHTTPPNIQNSRYLPLRWAPPELDPQFTYTVNITNGTAFYSIPHDVDVILNWPGTPVNNRVELSGDFRHLVSIGGETNQTVSSPSESTGRGIMIEGGARDNGIVHIEGHWFYGTGLTDAIYFSHPSRLQVVNCAMQNVGLPIADPTGSGIHSDGIQVVQGGALRVDKVSMDTYYQGVTASMSFGGMARSDLSRVDIVGHNPTGWSSGTTWLLGFYGAHTGEVPVWFQDVYLVPSSFTGTVAASISSPPTATTNPDGTVTWAIGSNYNGLVQMGPPLGGRYAVGNSAGGVGVPGRAYVTPGYLPADHDPLPSIWTPSAMQHVNATSLDDPVMAVADAATFTSGVPQVVKVPIQRGAWITSVNMRVSTAASGLTSGQCFVAVYDALGRQLGVSSDTSGSWGSTGNVSVSFNTPVVGMPDAFVWVYILFNGTTPPKLYGINSPLANIGLTAPHYRAGTVGSSITAAPSTFAVDHSADTSGITAGTVIPLVWV